MYYRIMNMVFSNVSVDSDNHNKNSGSDRGRKMSRIRSAIRQRRNRTASPGMPVIELKSVFLNEEWVRKCSRNLGQFIVVDSGCPRSLMGDEELDKLRELVQVQIFKVKNEGFRFGPSRVYTANRKVRFTMKVGANEMDCEFFVVHGKVPILLGNDVMAPLGGNIDMEENRLELKRADMEIPLERTEGGHFVIPIKSVTGLNYQNIRGEEADAVMMMVLEDTENDDLKMFHDKVGHNIFVSLALDSDEKAQVKKVHRYFGHRSSRRIWELFSKAQKLRGKKQAVYEIIDNCETCSALTKITTETKSRFTSSQ